MHRRIALFIFVFTVFLGPLQAQLSVSPYSRYGLGDLYNPSSTRNFSMGGLGIGIYDGSTVNRINPASYADLKLTTLDINGFGVYSQQKSNINSQSLGTAGFHNVSFGFSNKKGFGFVAGLAPYSSTGYDVIVKQELQVDTVSEPYSLTYSSDGGLNQFYIGAGVRFAKRFFAGANLTYAFGTTTFTTTSKFTNAGFNPVNIYSRSALKGFLPQIGLQYGDTLKINSTIDRAKATEQDIKSVRDALKDLDKEEAALEKEKEKAAAWEAEQNAKIKLLETEKARMQADVARLMTNEEQNKKEIGQLQDKSFRLEKKRKKLVREIKGRNRELRDAFANIANQRKRLTERKKVLQTELEDIKAGKREATTQRKKVFLLRVGGIVEPVARLNGSRLLEWDNTFVKDTLFNEDGNVRLPLKYGFGVSLSRANRWMIGADFTYQDWSQFSFFTDQSTLNGALGVNVGAEWIPNLVSSSYASRIAYRVGGSYKSSFLTLDNNPIAEYGISLGLGLPIGYFNTVGTSFSRVNVGVGLSRRGTLQGNLLEETTIQFRLGVNLNDVWFIKRVVD